MTYTTFALPKDLVSSWKERFPDVAVSFFCRVVLNNVLKSTDPEVAYQHCMFGKLSCGKKEKS